MYPQGRMSHHFSEMREGDHLAVKGPKGRFKYQPNQVKAFGMIAGGTGITPMYQVTRAILENPLDKTNITLIYANVTYEDILLKEELDDLKIKFRNRFKVYYVLNEPPDIWNGGVGFVSKEIIRARFPAPASNIKILRCGPAPMNKAMAAHLEALGYSAEAQRRRIQHQPRNLREAGWDGKLVNESYKWVERVVAFQPRMRQWQSAVRDGLLDVGVSPYNGFTYDHIYGTKVGGSIFDQNGHRHTAAADLLEYANTNTITLLLHAIVHRILFTINKGGSSSRPVAHGVVFKDDDGREHRAYLKQGSRNEIIVSAGALGSPQLLMLSGIGAAHHLREHNISVVLDQPLVGQGMSDNPMNAIYVPSPQPVEVSLIQVVGITNSGSYIEAASDENFNGGSRRDFGMFSPKITCNH